MRGGAGPVGGHAESVRSITSYIIDLLRLFCGISRFAVVIVPTYEDSSDAPSQAVLSQKRDWRWLSTVNRVCSGVKKVIKHCSTFSEVSKWKGHRIS